ncbi:MAG TPA: vanadium-dependent haloperoxidase [Chthoniobacterales bacterium]|nr:vanadium-dependent haloperoxidase [Chthoniobacterales bacterium]
MKTSSALCLGLCLAFAGDASALSFRDFFGSRFNPASSVAKNLAPKKALDSIHRWNQIAVDASGLDHTPVAPGELRTFGEQLGPGRASRAMAIVHIAIFDSVNAVAGGYQSYTGIPSVKPPVSLDAAVAQAAHDTLVAMFPSQGASFDSLLADDLAKINNKNERANGVSLGQRAAAAILALRANDGAQISEPRLGVNYFTSDQPAHWRQDPISLLPIALGAHWGECKPFVIQSGNQFRVPPPPAMDSPEYTAAYNEAKSLGGDGLHTQSTRTPEQSFIGVFWAYDGTPSLCAPPRLYNQIIVHIADQMHLGTVDLARLLAVANTAMADTGMAVWDSKFFYDFWRPVGGIREADTDGNPNTVKDASFTPMGAPASNLTGPNFTPPFPSYPSGHGGFGGALFQTLRRFFGTDNVAFTFVSDEFNGVTKDNSGTVRPYMPRSFANFSQAEEENGQSRIYLGIHWSFDKTEAISQGRNVANYVFDHAFLPVSKH